MILEPDHLKIASPRYTACRVGSWLACHTQEEIAGSVEVTRQAVATWEDEFTKKLEADNFVNWSNFTPPIYNVWKQQSKSNKVDHFLNSQNQSRIFR